MKVLLDTNIIIDNLARRDENKESLQIFDLCENGRLAGIVTTVTIMDVMYILRKHLGAAELRSAIQMLMQIMDVFPVQKNDISKTLFGGFTDFEDAVQASCAARAKADYIVTRNVKDFESSTVPAILPSDFLKRI